MREVEHVVWWEEELERGEGQAGGGKVVFVVTRGKWIDSVVTNDNGWGGV